MGHTQGAPSDPLLTAVADTPVVDDHDDVRVDLDRAAPPAARLVQRLIAGDVVVPALIFLMSRVAVLVTAQGVTWAHAEASVTGSLSAWDGGWYLAIARDGYPDDVVAELGGGGNRWAFYPGFPLLIRAMHGLTGLSYATSGIAVSMIAGTIASMVIWRLVAARLGRDAALLAVLIVCFFPAGYVLGMVYTESLFLLCVAVCLVAVDERRWVVAGLAASAASLTRSTGAVLVAVVVIGACFAAYRARSARPLLGVAIAPLGSLSWVAYQAARTGSPSASVDAQRFWGHEWVWFSTPFRSLWRVLTDRGSWSVAPDVMAAGALVLVVVSVALAVRFAVRRPGVVPVEWWLYSAGMLVVSFTPLWASSILRYTITLFPLYAVAWHTAPRWLTTTMVACSGVIMGSLAFGAFLGAITWQTAPFAP